MGDDSADRVGWIFHSISKNSLKPGDHIYCYGFFLTKYHAIYVGNDEVIYFDGDATYSHERSSAYIKKDTLSNFLGRSSLHLVAYNTYSAFFKQKSTCHISSCILDKEEVVKTAKYFYNNPKEWEDYHMFFVNDETFAFYCKTKSDDSALRVGRYSHAVSVDQLKPGDHIYCYGFLWIYSHHGIYIGKKDCEVIHFAGGPNEMKSKSSAFIRKCTLAEFLGSGVLRLVSYNDLNYLYRGSASRHSTRSRPARDVIATAEYYLYNPQEWESYNLLFNNCETFACFCKTGNKLLHAQGIGQRD